MEREIQSFTERPRILMREKSRAKSRISTPSHRHVNQRLRSLPGNSLGLRSRWGVAGKNEEIPLSPELFEQPNPGLLVVRFRHQFQASEHAWIRRTLQLRVEKV
jgi:hypothetical protein